MIDDFESALAAIERMQELVERAEASIQRLGCVGTALTLASLLPWFYAGFHTPRLTMAALVTGTVMLALALIAAHEALRLRRMLRRDQYARAELVKAIRDVPFPVGMSSLRKDVIRIRLRRIDV